MLFTRGPMTRDNTFGVDDLEFAVFRFTSQDIETRVVQLRFSDPSNYDLTCGFVANRTETRQGNG